MRNTKRLTKEGGDRQRDGQVYTRGGPVSVTDVFRLKAEGHFIWRTADGFYFTLERIEDDHLLNIELHLMGRSGYRKPSGYGPGNPRWENTYTIIRDEIERRGLELKESTGAPVRFDDEDFDRDDQPTDRFPEGELGRIPGVDVWVDGKYVGKGEIHKWE